MPRSGYPADWLTLCAGFLLAVAVFRMVDQLERREDRIAFEQAAFDRVTAIEVNAIESMEIVRSTGDFLSVVDDISEQAFSRFVAPAVERQMKLTALEWVPRVTAAERVRHENATRIGYGITELDAGGRPRPAGERPDYYPVRFVEPTAGNENALGFDVGSEPGRREALERARDSGTLAVTGPVRLVQESQTDQLSILAFYPVFERGARPDTIAERRRRLRGFALGVFRVTDVIATPFYGAPLNGGMDLYVFDVEADTLLYRERLARGSSSAPLLSIPQAATGLMLSKQLRLGGRQWRIVARPTGPLAAPWQAWAAPWQAWAAGTALLVISVLLAAYLRASRARTESIRRQVDERTGALNTMVRNLTRLHDISTDVNAPFKERVEKAMDLGRDMFGLPLAMVSRVTDDRYTVMYVRGPEGAPEAGSVFSVGDTYCERTLAADNPVGFHRAAGTDWERHPCYAQFSLEAYLGTPLRAGNEVYGTLNFTSPEPRSTPFSDEDHAFVSLFSQWIGNEIDRARSLEALTESFERYQSVLRDSLQGVVIDRDGAPLYANGAFARIFGYTDAHEIMQLSSLDPLYAPEELERIHRFRLDRLRGGHDRLPSRYEFRGRRKDGTEIWCEHLTQPVEWMGEPAVRTFTQDISARKQATREVERLLLSRTAELRLRDRAIHAASNGILITDARAPDNPIVYVNPAFERITGYPSEEIIGRNCRFLQNDDRDQPDRSKIRRAIEAGQSVKSVLRNYRKDGTLFWNAVEIGPVRDPDGRITHFIGVQTDITEERQREEQIRALQRLEAVGRLTGGVAHDFNNLLTVIVGNLRLASTLIPDNDKANDRIEGATAAAFRGAALVRQLLAFARRQILEPEVLQPAQAVTRTCTLLQRTFQESVKLEVRVDQDTASIRVDPAQLETSLVNLAINARDAMRNGGALTIGVADAVLNKGDKVLPPNAVPGRYACITVKDTGEGMSDAVLAQAVEPFFTTKDVGEGSGLGLSMVYGFARQSGGFLDMESQPGRGTRVRLFLPSWTGETGEAPPAPGKAGTLPGGDESLLVVEDENDVREITVAMLKMLGYRVTAAADGRAALRLLEDGVRIDLLLTDVVMPAGMSGAELARAARRLRPGIGVLYMSGHAADAIALAADGDVPFDLLKKPFSDDELARRVRVALDGKPGERPPPPAGATEKAR